MKVDCDKKISVVIVCYNEKNKISSCIRSLLKQTLNADQYEIIIIDNNSNDGTKEIVKRFCDADKRVRMIINPARGIAISRNIGLQEASNDFIAFTDADCVVPGNWLETMYNGFQKYYALDDKVVAVGGSNFPPEIGNNFYDAVAITLDTFWGNHGSTQGKLFLEDSFVDHIPTVNVFYKKNILLKYGGFDEYFGNICEDPELNFRLTKAGYKIVFLKDCYVWHHMRDNLRDWAQNMITYGKGRIWLIRKHIDHLRIMYLVPPIFSLALMATPLGLWKWWFSLPLVYFPVIFLISLWHCAKKGKINLIHLVMIIYFLDHFFYGIGEIYGLFRNRDTSRTILKDF
jgi:glycosyltransferase involved in cell wall biosynthesis